MATINKIEDFQAWVKARELNSLVQAMVLEDTFRQFPNLKFQMQKTSRSVMSNLAEGFSRTSNAEFLHFISIALGSLNELKSDIYGSNDQKLISDSKLQILIGLVNEIGKLSNGMIRYLKRSPLKGSKFNKNVKSKKPNQKPKPKPGPENQEPGTKN